VLEATASRMVCADGGGVVAAHFEIARSIDPPP
jgi:hypothetical protein